MNVGQVLKFEKEKEKKELPEEMFLLDAQVLVEALLEDLVTSPGSFYERDVFMEASGFRRL